MRIIVDHVGYGVKVDEFSGADDELLEAKLTSLVA
jgi:hypothetical protein